MEVDVPPIDARPAGERASSQVWVIVVVVVVVGLTLGLM